MIPTGFKFILFFTLIACSTDAQTEDNSNPQEQSDSEALASITAVAATGESGAYTFNVTIASPDTGCEQYADWWEIINLEGDLIYRRILGHSHVNEQPFTRGGGPVAIDESTAVYIRAHMNSSSYGTQVFKGTVKDGFTAMNLASDFSKDLETKAPLPQNCAF